MTEPCRFCGTPVDLDAPPPRGPKGQPQPAPLRRRRFDPASGELLEEIVTCADCIDRIKPTRRITRRPFALTADERAAFFAGQPPVLIRDQEPTFELPYRHELSKLLTIEITRTTKRLDRATSSWRWHLRYTVRDARLDRPRLLRQNPPAHRTEHDEEDRMHPLTPATEARAAEESAYTSSRLSAVPNEPENTDDPRALAAGARLRGARRRETDRAEEMAKRQARSINENVRDALLERARAGKPADSPGVAALHRAVEQIRAETANEEAA